jgi:hypothetical protein
VRARPGSVGKHKDYTLAEITAGLDSAAVPKYVEVRPDGAVRLTSARRRRHHPELDALPHRVPGARPVGRQGACGVVVEVGPALRVRVGKIIKLPQGRQRVCIAQVHTPDDDLCMVLVDQGVNVESTYGDKGRPGG